MPGFEQAATLFGVGKSSVQRRTERLEPCGNRNKPATKIDTELLEQAQAAAQAGANSPSGEDSSPSGGWLGGGQ